MEDVAGPDSDVEEVAAAAAYLGDDVDRRAGAEEEDGQEPEIELDLELASFLRSSSDAMELDVPPVTRETANEEEEEEEAVVDVEALLHERAENIVRPLNDITTDFTQLQTQSNTVADRVNYMVELVLRTDHTPSPFEVNEAILTLRAEQTKLIDSVAAVIRAFERLRNNTDLWVANLLVAFSKSSQTSPTLTHNPIEETEFGLNADNPTLPPNRHALPPIETIRMGKLFDAPSDEEEGEVEDGEDDEADIYDSEIGES
jgi:hypothetical protein